MKVNYKRLKAVLASKVRNFGLVSIALKLGEFPLFDDFFLNLADFWDLDNFLPFEFPDFLAISSPSSTLNLSTLLLPTSNHLKIELFNGIVVFSIELSGAAILLKP